MSGYEYAFRLTPGGPSRARSLTIACVAIAAVCVLSSTVVMRELVGPEPARASAATPSSAATASTPAVTAARTWPLEPRWWPGEIRQTVRTVATVPESELTFTKGYQLRLAARQATPPTAQPASPPAQLIAVAPAAETKSSRTAGPVRKATTVAPTETPDIRRVTNPLIRFDVGTRALAYDEQRPSERGVAETRRAPSRGLFGTLY